MSRVEQINQLLLSELANLIQKHIDLPGGLITVTEVDCSPNLEQARIFVSVLPDKLYGTALKRLRRGTGFLRKKLGKLNLRTIPKIIWKIDAREKYAAEIDKLLEEK